MNSIHSRSRGSCRVLSGLALLTRALHCLFGMFNLLSKIKLLKVAMCPRRGIFLHKMRITCKMFPELPGMCTSLLEMI